MYFRKISIKRIIAPEECIDVENLRRSIARFGLLQPICVTKKDGKYLLIFGHRRLQACRELGYKRIPCAVFNVREEKIKRIKFEETFQKRRMGITEMTNSALEISEKCELLLDAEESEKIKNYLMLSPDAKQKADKFESLINLSGGNGEKFLSAIAAAEEAVRAKKKVRLCIYNDRRIFLNEIQRILALMRKEGFCDIIDENDERIVIKKIC